MNKAEHLAVQIGFVSGLAIFLGVLVGCIGYVDGPRPGGVYVPPPSVQVEAGFVVQDDYVYYPGYQVYYSSNRRQYVYLEGRSWVSRPAPRRAVRFPVGTARFPRLPGESSRDGGPAVPEKLGASGIETRPGGRKPGQWTGKRPGKPQLSDPQNNRAEKIPGMIITL